MTEILKRAKEFESDFTEVMLSIAALAGKHNLPSPAVLLPREWEATPKSHAADGERHATLQLSSS